MNYLGKNQGSYSFNGNGGRAYRGGDNDIERQAWVHPSDVAVLERTSRWVIAPEPPKKTESAPVPSVAESEVIATVPAVEAVGTLTAAPAIEAVQTVTAAPEVKITTDSLTSTKRKSKK
jgi:hypothetical protein